MDEEGVDSGSVPVLSSSHVKVSLGKNAEPHVAPEDMCVSDREKRYCTDLV